MKQFKIKSGCRHFAVFAKNRVDAVKKFRDAQAKRVEDDIQSKIDISDYQPKEISYKRIEDLPLKSRQELQNSKNKEATLLSIEVNIEDIINSANPEIRGDLQRIGSKILSDLRKQFKITDNEIQDCEIEDELIQSGSEEAFKKNIATEIRAGKDPKQAAAIAYSVQRENDSKVKDMPKGVFNRYFAVSNGASETYKSREEMMKDLKNFGDDEVRVYSLKQEKDIQNLGSEDLMFVWKEGRIIKKGPMMKDSAIKDNYIRKIARNAQELKSIIRAWNGEDLQVSIQVSNTMGYDIYYYKSKDGYYNIPRKINSITVYDLTSAKQLALKYADEFFDNPISDSTITDLDGRLLSKSSKELKEELGLAKRVIGSHSSRGIREYKPRNNQFNNEDVAEINEAINDAIKYLDQGLGHDSYRRLEIDLYRIKQTMPKDTSSEEYKVLNKVIAKGSKALRVMREYLNNRDYSIRDALGEYTIEINNEILEDDFGNSLRFNSYNEAREYIEDHELKGAFVTRQYGLSDSLDNNYSICDSYSYGDFERNLGELGIHGHTGTLYKEAKRYLERNRDNPTRILLQDSSIKDKSIADAKLVIPIRTARENLPDIDEDLHWYNTRYGSLDFDKNDSYLTIVGSQSDLDKFVKQYHLNDSHIKDSSDYTINYRNTDTGERNKETVKANSVIESIKKFADAVALRGWGTRNIYIISIFPNDGYVRLYGSLQALLASKEFRDCDITNKITTSVNDANRTTLENVIASRGFMPYKDMGNGVEVWKYREQNEDEFEKQVQEIRNRFPHLVESSYSEGDYLFIQVDYNWAVNDAKNTETKNWVYIMYGSDNREYKVENLTKAEAEHLLSNNKLLGYDGKIYER